MSGAIAAMLGGAPTFSATVVPSTASGLGVAPATIQTVTVANVVVQGGVPPYTYSWQYVSGSTSIYARNPSSDFTRFAAYLPSSATLTAVYKCVVTDALATAIDSTTITVTIDG